jgi:hypothetical protein
MGTMRDFDRSFALASKASKDRSITRTCLRRISEGGINSITAKTSDSVCLEVRSCCAIFGILKTADTVDFAFALHCGTLEEVELAAILVSNSYLGLEETIHSGVPTDLKTFWSETMSEKN